MGDIDVGDMESNRAETLRAVREWCEQPSVSVMGDWEKLRAILGVEYTDSDRPAVRAILDLFQPSSELLAWYERLERLVVAWTEGMTYGMAAYPWAPDWCSGQYPDTVRGYQDYVAALASAALRDKPSEKIDPPAWLDSPDGPGRWRWRISAEKPEVRIVDVFDAWEQLACWDAGLIRQAKCGQWQRCEDKESEVAG